jgi:methyltransferase (TIGR00027 family)
LAARTLAFDAAITDALNTDTRQVVIVGGGYDARAWRMARPGVRYWEVDHPATQGDKQRAAPRGPGPTYVPVDLDTDGVADKLRSAGLGTTEATVFSAEGLTMYLAGSRVRALFAALADVAAPGSTMVTNFGVGFAPSGAGGVKGLVREGLVSMRGEPLRFEPSVETATALLSEAGWTVTETVIGPELGRRYLVGSGLPTGGLNPAAFVVTARGIS